MAQSSAKGEIELQSISIFTELPYFPDDLWLKIFQYIDDPRQLAQNISICKRFHALLTRSEYVWKGALSLIQAEYIRIISRGLSVPLYVNFPRHAPNYQKVAGYGRSIHGYYVEIEKNKPKPKTKLERMLGPTTLIGNSVILGLVTLFYLFFILLGVTLDGTASIPSWVFFILITFLCFIMIGVTGGIWFWKPASLDFLRVVITCNRVMMIGIFLFAFNLLFLAIFSLVFNVTGQASTGVWVFCGLGYGLTMFLLFTFECRAGGLQYRYSMAFRLFMSVSFTCFCLGVVMFVYTDFNRRSNSDSFGWAIAAWVFSYIILVFYLFCLALCFGNGYQAPRGCKFCLFGTMEALTCALIFSTAVMIYLNVVGNYGIPWVQVFIPIYLLPLFLTSLCCTYRRTYSSHLYV